MQYYKHIRNTLLSVSVALIATSCASTNKELDTQKVTLPSSITINSIAQNPEGIEYDKNDNTFLLSSLNAGPIVKVDINGSYTPFTHGEKFPLSTAGLQVDYKHNRLLVAGFNGTELMDNDVNTKGVSFLRMYNLETGLLENEIELSHLVPDAPAYFANDVALDDEGNVYISDWYAGVIYKVDLDGQSSLFWQNDTGIPSGVNGLDVHKDGYLLASLLKVNEKGLYSDFALVKIALNAPQKARVVDISDAGFSGFDGMVIKANGNVVGVTNNQKTAGGNSLIELTSSNGYTSASILHSKAITKSTTVALTADETAYVINQDFSDNFAQTWRIEKVEF